MSLIELLGISGFKANSDRVLTVEALTSLTSLIRMGFPCKDVSIEEIISSTGTLLVLKQIFGPVALPSPKSYDLCPCNMSDKI